MEITDILLDNSSESASSEPTTRPVFILDDSAIGIHAVSRPLDEDDVNDIIKSMTDLDQTFTGPLIISMREETWKYIVTRSATKKGFSEQRLEDIVEMFVLQPLEEEESKNFIRSFFTSVEGKKPAYPNLVLDESNLKKIADLTRRNLTIAQLFFDKMGGKAAEKSYVISLKDIEEIINDSILCDRSNFQLLFKLSGRMDV